MQAFPACPQALDAFAAELAVSLHVRTAVLHQPLAAAAAAAPSGMCRPPSKAQCAWKADIYRCHSVV